VTAESAIRCGKHISFGDDCLLSWEVLIIDQDFHSIATTDQVRTNPDANIEIGKHVWICCRNTILKGTIIGADSVLAAGSLIASKFPTTHQLLGGNPARVLRRDISWS